MSAEQSTEHEQPSLYRRHRPRTFAEVVGQEPVVRTLRNAVERDKVHHAYLFVGSRGTGKTSMAKILAACLNCERGPTVEPCGVCASCVSIANASSLDVIEMDAASNNSVDDIRELRESVAYAPVSGRRKVYILDEAHMLSTAAWNAFLKTLEEPPPNTVFVLATTEAGKVPATVVDRCHRFDFHRPSVEQIAAVVRRAADAEDISIPPAAVAALARSATGSFRDALGTLEQIVTYCGGEISLEDVLTVLGVADAGLLEATVDAVDEGDAPGALAQVETCLAQGRDAVSFAGDLETRARELMITGIVGAVPADLSLTPEADAALLAQAERVPEATVVRLLELLGEAMEAVRAGADARTRLELALVKAARPEVDPSMRALLSRIERLEQGAPRAAAAPRPAPPAAGAGAPGGAPAPQAAPAATPAGPATPAGQAPGAGSSPASPLAPAPGPAQPAAATPPPGPARPAAAAPAPGPAQPDAASALAAPADAPAERADAPPPVGGSPVTAAAQSRAAAATAAGASADAGGPEPAAPSADLPPEPVTAPVPGDLGALLSLWPAVVDLVRSENALLGAVIEQARPVEADGEELVLAFAPTAPFLKKKAEDPAKRMAVAEALRAVTGTRFRLSYELREAAVVQVDGGAPAPAVREEDWVQRFVDEFDAEEIPGDWDEQGSSPPGGEGAAVTSNEKGA